MGVHLDAVVFAATLIRWLECATIGGAGEGEELVESITQAAECTAGSIHSTVWRGLAPVLVLLANDLLGDLNEAINNVADRPP